MWMSARWVLAACSCNRLCVLGCVNTTGSFHCQRSAGALAKCYCELYALLLLAMQAASTIDQMDWHKSCCKHDSQPISRWLWWCLDYSNSGTTRFQQGCLFFEMSQQLLDVDRHEIHTFTKTHTSPDFSYGTIIRLTYLFFRLNIRTLNHNALSYATKKILALSYPKKLDVDQNHYTFWNQIITGKTCLVYYLHDI